MRDMQAAFAKVGILPEDAEFDIAIVKYLNAGGTLERAQARLDIAARRMPEPGPSGIAHVGRDVNALLRHPEANGAGRHPHAVDYGGRTHFASPVRGPSANQRTAAATVSKLIAITVLDTLKIDGRSIGDWTVGEARKIGPTKTREGFILIQATRRVANASGAERIRDVLKASELQTIMQRAAQMSDAL